MMKFILLITFIGIFPVLTFSSSHCVDQLEMTRLEIVNREPIWDVKKYPSIETVKEIQSRQTNGHSILWWNLRFGSLKELFKRDILAENLEFIGCELSPDILVFGEFNALNISEKSLKRLESLGYQRLEFSYNRNDHHYFGIFSKVPIDSKNIEIFNLNWMPVKNNKNYRERWLNALTHADNFDRVHLKIKIKIGNKEVSLYPTHLVQPWGYYATKHMMNLNELREKNESERSRWENFFSKHSGRVPDFLAEFAGKIETLLQMWMSKTSPLHNNAKSLIEKIDTDGSDHKIIVGDFNLPRRLVPSNYDKGFGPIPNTIKLFLNRFKYVFSRNRDQTFPAFSAPEAEFYPPFQIDHAFISEGLSSDYSKVLPLKGSDHYPILFFVE